MTICHIMPEMPISELVPQIRVYDLLFAKPEQTINWIVSDHGTPRRMKMFSCLEQIYRRHERWSLHDQMEEMGNYGHNAMLRSPHYHNYLQLQLGNLPFQILVHTPRNQTCKFAQLIVYENRRQLKMDSRSTEIFQQCRGFDLCNRESQSEYSRRLHLFAQSVVDCAL